ncbi:glycerophosphodiester phosphodiesterase family protein [Nigerium massiliense]|uniref:glycerophosphodiester phosphodiesterase family protein n=1 Tax=Nigerium massiliense TaxID=1522317 RepID=UPI0005908210|nr:glycerophosphodiester phosphodiesterase family protein [Nigerium massiliense]
MPDRHPYFGRFTALAHRGGYGGDVPPALENTLTAFRNARALGFRAMETDIHVTADGQVVAFHDDVLDRVTDGAGAIADLTYAELADTRIGGSEPVPLLNDVLDAVPDCTLNIDIKSDAGVEPLADLIERRGVQDRVCVGSFDTARIHRFRRLTRRSVATSVSAVGVAWLAAPLLPLLGRPGGVAAQVPTRVPRLGVPLVTERFVAACHRAGKLVHVWTINDADEMNRLLDLGVDGLVSDDLLTLRDVVTSRGLWEDL